MAVKLRRPILVGGVSLTFGLWLLDLFYHSLARVGESAAVGAAILGAGVWLLHRRSENAVALPAIASPIDRSAVENALAEVTVLLQQLDTELETARQPHSTVAACQERFQEQCAQLSSSLERTQIQIAAIGRQGTGKTSLIQALTTHEFSGTQCQPCLQDTSAVLSGASADTAIDEQVMAQALTADLVLFVTTGDLTEPEFQLVQRLVESKQQLLVVCNKQDLYLPGDVNLVLQQLQHRLEGRVAAADAIAIATQPNPTKVRQHQTDTSVKEWLEPSAPNIANLTERLEQILTQDSQALVLATTWRSAQALKSEVQAGLNQLRRSLALPLIDQFQWIAAGTAFANPLPALDLLATAAINAQMVLDLGALYQQKLSLQQAQTVATTMAQLLFKLGIVELSTQTISHLLKSNAMTFVAGGLVQGASAAYLTRIAGLGLVEYFQNQPNRTDATGNSAIDLDALKQHFQTIIQQSQRLISLPTLVNQALTHLTGTPTLRSQPDASPQS